MNYDGAALKTTPPLPSLDWMLKFFTHIKKIFAVAACLALLWAVCLISGLSSPLHFAVKAEFAPAVRLLSKAGLTNDAWYGYYSDCYTPLELALQKGNIAIVDILLDDGADLMGECKGYIGIVRPIPHDVLTGSVLHPALLEHLIKERHISPDIESDYFHGLTPIFATLECGDPLQRRDITPKEEGPRIKSLHILVENGANVNAVRVHDGQVPLSAAIINGCTDIALYLLKHGADFKLAKEAVETRLSKVRDYPGQPYSRAEMIRTTLQAVEEAAAAK